MQIKQISAEKLRKMQNGKVKIWSDPWWWDSGMTGIGGIIKYTNFCPLSLQFQGPALIYIK